MDALEVDILGIENPIEGDYEKAKLRLENYTKCILDRADVKDPLAMLCGVLSCANTIKNFKHRIEPNVNSNEEQYSGMKRRRQPISSTVAQIFDHTQIKDSVDFTDGDVPGNISNYFLLDAAFDCISNEGSILEDFELLLKNLQNLRRVTIVWRMKIITGTSNVKRLGKQMCNRLQQLKQLDTINFSLRYVSTLTDQDIIYIKTGLGWRETRFDEYSARYVKNGIGWRDTRFDDRFLTTTVSRSRKRRRLESFDKIYGIASLLTETSRHYSDTSPSIFGTWKIEEP